LKKDSSWPFSISLETANVAAFDSGKQANPQFSATGKSVSSRIVFEMVCVRFCINDRVTHYSGDIGRFSRATTQGD
jgi:hypothetical protein